MKGKRSGRAPRGNHKVVEEPQGKPINKASEKAQTPTASPGEILEHLGYEWWMFQSMISAVDRLPNHSPDRNSAIESMAIHGRALIEFFFDRKDGSYAATAWNVTNLGMGYPTRKKPQELVNWYDETGRRVAHLTEYRVREMGELDVKGVHDQLSKEIRRVIRELNVDPNWIGSRISIEDLNGPLTRINSMGGNTGASNAAPGLWTGPTPPPLASE